MPFGLTFSREGDILRFEVTGVRVPGELTGEMIAVWTRVAQECRATGANCVLGVNRLTGPVSATETYQIGQQVPGILGGAVRRLAFVVLGDREAFRANLFFEDVAVNRGLEARVFDDEAKARDWLRAGVL
jgi:hypothetical protein